MLRPERARKRFFYVSSIVLVVGLLLAWLPWAQEHSVVAAEVQVSGSQFREYVETWSEPEGYFDSDNFISNETSYLHVIGELRQRVKPGGVYLGVGPDQNFSYIVNTRPALAIVVDIRRQNMLEHLWYKALFELSATRTEFLSRLTGVTPPPDVPSADLDGLLARIRRAKPDEEYYRNTLRAVRELVDRKYKLALTAEDWRKIEYVAETFHRDGLSLRFSSIGRGNAANYPTFETLLMEADNTGQHWNYLASEELFRWMKTFEYENRLIPIVGDFSGPSALRAVAKFLNDSGLQVSLFYTSNVEFYLFGASGWEPYLRNVQAIPWAEQAVFIRAYFSGSGPRHPQNVAGHRSTTLVQDVHDFISGYAAGRLRSYWDIVTR